MPLAFMHRKQPEDGEAAGLAVRATLDPPPAKRTRGAVARAAAAAAAAPAAAAQRREGQGEGPPRQGGEQQGGAAGTSSAVGSTMQDRCGSSDPRTAGGVDSMAPSVQQLPQPAAVAAPAAPQTQGALQENQPPAQQQQPQQQPQRPGQQQQPQQPPQPPAHVRQPVPAAEQPPAKRRRVERQGVPPPLPRVQLQVPDRPSPPFRADDADGHYVFEIGENLAPRFKIMRKFGEGTFGQVLECWDRHRRDYVAVKVIRNIQKYRDAAKIELEVLSTLAAHDPAQAQHCVRLLEWFDYRGHVCMVFERLGPSLYDYLRKNSYRPFPLAMARDFVRQMLESVAFMHGLTLVHTDLKPENVLVTSLESKAVQGRPSYGPGSKLGKRLPVTSQVRVIDFGSATFDADYHSSIVSTRHYRPEIILGLGWSFPADMWSLGCILVELVTGDALFQTHENLEHLAMMQAVLGPMPEAMALRASDAAAAYFLQGRLNWPAGAESKKSVRAVQRLKSLDEFLYKQMDESMRPHLDTLVDLTQRLMAYEPAQRITAEVALQHPFFSLELPPA